MKKEVDKLEKFISENRNEFDFLEVPKGLWDKINEEESEVNNSRQINWKVIFSRAAILIMVFMASYFVNDWVRLNSGKNLADQSNEDPLGKYLDAHGMKDAKLMFTSQFNLLMTEIQDYAEQYPELVEELKNEIKELDTEANGLEKDLGDNVSNEEIVEAMVSIYKIKLKILEDYLTEIRMDAGVEPNNEINYEKDMDI